MNTTTLAVPITGGSRCPAFACRASITKPVSTSGTGSRIAAKRDVVLPLPELQDAARQAPGRDRAHEQQGGNRLS
ncbi:hypothetical protein F4556_000014 [Kitasatospora gansuensis]|uniref:Uncharacterized protein n=1 Tax=Kitasatospora gansuensis TaxID=258050 RepID=A0A7W7S5W2_9ACTN|nr:hypothetical protein [Kitasatospora gansuensis]MBB4944479.1 hypothetical protein [Kitasatospora gansuensis]